MSITSVCLVFYLPQNRINDAVIKNAKIKTNKMSSLKIMK